ncbi:MAG: hypothetical protein AAGB34_10785, partial [Planctomycetota bacterium]
MLVGATFRFDKEVVFALTGAPVSARLNQRPVPMWRAISARRDDILSIGALASGVCSLLCVRGGIVTESVLGSRSTHVSAQFGGIDGRPLRARDKIRRGSVSRYAEASDASGDRSMRDTMADIARYVQRRSIRVVLGPHTHMISGDVRSLLEGDDYTISVETSRVGTRLEGKKIVDPPSGSMETEAAWPGAIQLLPSRLPIVLGPEAAPTGGYPIIASVIAADLPSFAQKRAGDCIRFVCVTLEEARQADLAARSSLDHVLHSHVQPEGVSG